MNELERRIEKLEYQLKEAQIDLNISEDMYVDDIKGYRFYNVIMALLVMALIILLVTKQCSCL